MYASVVNDGGFTFGMDGTTPVSWVFHRRPRYRGLYRTWSLPATLTAAPAFRTWLERNPAPVLTLGDLQTTLRAMDPGQSAPSTVAR